MSSFRGSYTADPLLTGAWQVSDWDVGQSSILRWSPKQVKWNSTDQTLDFTMDKATKGAGAGRPYVSGEVQSIASAYEGTWSWTAKAPDMVSGSVFGLFTFQKTWETDRWLEFDFEFLGIDAGKDPLDINNDGITYYPSGSIDGDSDPDIYVVRLNIHMEVPVEGSTDKHITLEQQQGSILVPLSFDATEVYGTYSVKVTKEGATFYINGQPVSLELTRTDGTEETTSVITRDHMPENTWYVGQTEMKSFVNLWMVDTDPKMEEWAGKWTYPGKPLVGQLAAAEYTTLDGTKTLIGGTGPVGSTPTPVGALTDADGDGIVIGTSASEAYEAKGGDIYFQFKTKPFGKDTIYNFDPLATNADGTANAEHDVVTISKTMAGVTGFAGLYRKITDLNGDAVLKIDDANTITFEGLKKADLGYDDFILV